jgi:TatD DNase family protein
VAPAERLLVETDSPFLAPVPKRGTRCEPAFVPFTLRALAEARGDDVEELAAATTSNALALFGLGEKT